MTAPGRGTATALVLVDVQHDFLDRPGLVPDREALCERAVALLWGWRELGLPVAHVHTRTLPDGSDRMPHWRATGFTACVAGTRGARPPEGLEPVDGELVVRKRFYSGFAAPALDAWLRANAVSSVVVAGLYTHGCVRSTVLDAYERGYEVRVADDAVATVDVEHGAATRGWLDGRAARFVPVDELLAGLATPPT